MVIENQFAIGQQVDFFEITNGSNGFVRRKGTVEKIILESDGDLTYSIRQPDTKTVFVSDNHIIPVSKEDEQEMECFAQTLQLTEVQKLLLADVLSQEVAANYSKRSVVSSVYYGIM